MEKIGKIKEVKRCWWCNGNGYNPDDHCLMPSTDCDQCGGEGTLTTYDEYRPIGIKIEAHDSRRGYL